MSLPKLFFVFLLAGFCASVRAAVLAGPEVNPANGHLYYLLTQNTWSNAEAEAVSLGGHLATVRNAAEERWIYSTFGQSGGALWIGLTDRDQLFNFKWTSGEPVTYTNWEANQPDNGTGGGEYYVHIWPPGSRSPGKWNDYLNVDGVSGFPFYGVAEISLAPKTRVALRPSANPARVEAVANSAALATAVAASGLELRASTAIELSWLSESNLLYQVQWTPSLASSQWTNLASVVAGTGGDVSVFDSTRIHPAGFYRVQVVQ